MRKFKFRFWDNRKNEMWNESEISMIIIEGQTISPLFDSGSEYREIEDAKNIITMQFTGLKDKKGKEIYEGDIVDFYSNVEDEVITEKVDYSFGMYRAGDYHLGKIFGKCEVIGNIYENENLLVSK